MIKFNKHHVTDGTIKARCHYSLDNRTDKRACVTIYAKDYGDALGKLFASEYKNDTDIMTDYFDKGRVVLFADHPLYAAARARAEQNNREMNERVERKESARRAADAEAYQAAVTGADPIATARYIRALRSVWKR